MMAPVASHWDAVVNSKRLPPPPDLAWAKQQDTRHRRWAFALAAAAAEAAATAVATGAANCRAAESERVGFVEPRTVATVVPSLLPTKLSGRLVLPASPVAAAELLRRGKAWPPSEVAASPRLRPMRRSSSWAPRYVAPTPSAAPPPLLLPRPPSWEDAEPGVSADTGAQVPSGKSCRDTESWKNSLLTAAPGAIRRRDSEQLEQALRLVVNAKQLVRGETDYLQKLKAENDDLKKRLRVSTNRATELQLQHAQLASAQADRENLAREGDRLSERIVKEIRGKLGMAENETKAVSEPPVRHPATEELLEAQRKKQTGHAEEQLCLPSAVTEERLETMLDRHVANVLKRNASLQDTLGARLSSIEGQLQARWADDSLSAKLGQLEAQAQILENTSDRRLGRVEGKLNSIDNGFGARLATIETEIRAHSRENRTRFDHIDSRLQVHAWTNNIAEVQSSPSHDPLPARLSWIDAERRSTAAEQAPEHGLGPRSVAREPRTKAVTMPSVFQRPTEEARNHGLGVSTAAEPARIHPNNEAGKIMTLTQSRLEAWESMQHRCAICIQRHARGFLGRQRVRRLQAVLQSVSTASSSRRQSNVRRLRSASLATAASQKSMVAKQFQAARIRQGAQTYTDPRRSLARFSHATMNSMPTDKTEDWEDATAEGGDADFSHKDEKEKAARAARDANVARAFAAARSPVHASTPRGGDQRGLRAEEKVGLRRQRQDSKIFVALSGAPEEQPFVQSEGMPRDRTMLPPPPVAGSAGMEGHNVVYVNLQAGSSDGDTDSLMSQVIRNQSQVSPGRRHYERRI